MSAQALKQNVYPLDKKEIFIWHKTTVTHDNSACKIEPDCQKTLGSTTQTTKTNYIDILIDSKKNKLKCVAK